MNKKELLECNIIKPCNCKICQLFVNLNLDSVVYQILNTKYRVRILFGKTGYWAGCPRSIESVPCSFEEIFDCLRGEDRDSIIYNLNLF